MNSSEHSSSLHEVYKQRLLALFRDPAGGGIPAEGALRGWAKNRTCGDEVSFYSLLISGKIERCWQDTAGCAIATATASLLVGALAGKPQAEALEILRRIRRLVYEGEATELDEDLRLLAAVHELPTRHECVGVALKAAAQSLNGEDSLP